MAKNEHNAYQGAGHPQRQQPPQTRQPAQPQLASIEQLMPQQPQQPTIEQPTTQLLQQASMEQQPAQLQQPVQTNSANTLQLVIGIAMIVIALILVIAGVFVYVVWEEFIVSFITFFFAGMLLTIGGATTLLTSKPLLSSLGLCHTDDVKSYLNATSQILGDMDPASFNKLALDQQMKNLQARIANISELTTDLEKDLKTANESNEAYEENLNQLNGDNSELHEKVQQLEGEKIDLESENASYKTQLDELKSQCEAYKNSDTGMLIAEIDSLKEQNGKLDERLKEKDGKIEELNNSVAEFRQQLQDEKDNAGNHVKNIADKDAEIELLQQQINDKESVIAGHVSTINGHVDTIKRHEATIEDLGKKIAAHDTVVAQKDSEISRVKDSVNALNDKVNSLTAQISGLNSAIAQLTADKEALAKETDDALAAEKVKTAFINQERDAYAHEVALVADQLATAAAADFLSAADEDSRPQRDSLQKRVSGSAADLRDELANVNVAEAASRQDLEDKYHAIIKDYLDDTTVLTRIAQWYAYSSVPFMVDGTRTDGIVVMRAPVRRLYDIASRLIALVGARFIIPALYAETLTDDYHNATGERQLNIEYMCSSARNHKHNIDAPDTEPFVIDVVEVGYADSRGNSRQPQVIL